MNKTAAGEKAKRICMAALLADAAIMFSYIEYLIPVSSAFPGVKPGLANIAVIFALYELGIYYAAAISLVKVIVSAILFSNPAMLIYSAAGALICLPAMYIAKKTSLFSVIGTSVTGGVAHNIGQLIAALIMTESKGILYYFPILLISGCVFGAIIGIISAIVIKKRSVKKSE